MKKLSHRQIRNLLQNGEALTVLERRLIQRHLAECQGCRSYAGNLTELAFELSGGIDVPELTREKRQRLVNNIRGGVQERRRKDVFLQPLKTVTIAAMAIAVVFGLVFTMERLVPSSEPAADQDGEGIVFEIPVEPGPQILLVEDMDCNGEEEELIADWQFISTGKATIFGISKLSIVNNNYSSPIVMWQYDNSEIEISHFLMPQIFNLSECEVAITVPVKSRWDATGHLEVYKWSRNRMELLMTANGWPRGYSSDYLESPTGRCLVEIQTFVWDGEKFVLGEIEQRTIRCQRGY